MEKPLGAAPRQRLLLCFLSLLSPMTRWLPRVGAEGAGGGVWLGALFALPAALGWCLLLPLLDRGFSGDGAGAFRKAWGRRPGRLLSMLSAAWLVLSAGIAMRWAAERLLSAVYTQGKAWVLVLLLALTAAAGALGGGAALSRSAGVTACLLLPVLLPLIAAAFGKVRPTWLLPDPGAGARELLLPAVPVLALVVQGAWGALLPQRQAGEALRRRQALLWGGAVSLAALAMLLVTVGGLSAPLCRRLKSPFFALIRTVRLFHSLERMESVVLGLWVMSDFLLLSLRLQLAARLLAGGTAAEGEKGAGAAGRGAAADGKTPKGVTAVCLALTVGIALLPAAVLPPLRASLEWTAALGELVFAGVLLPLTAALAARGRRGRGRSAGAAP